MENFDHAGGSPLILLTGATGYIGGRLLKALEEGGRPVRCLARRPEFLQARVGPGTEVVAGDCLDPSTLPRAMAGVHTAYYLVHSMGSRQDFEEQDRQAAENFVNAARQAGVQRIIYLGGLGEPSSTLSSHLRSRQEVGEILRSSTVPVVEFRASIILGSGSLSFEMIRALVERLPVMICPRWVSTAAQPIAIEDVVAYLLAALSLPADEHRVFEIGGADQVSYADIMREYARQRGLRRWMISVPVLTPRLSSLWLGLVTPVYARVGRKLVDSLRHPTVVRDGSATRVFRVRPRGLCQAMERALHNEDREFAQTRWSDALSSGGRVQSWGGLRFGTRLVDSRTVQVKGSPRIAFAPIRRIGGDTGWYFADSFWRLRGFLDLLAGGVGLRRGRRDRETLQLGDTLDFWRVEEFEADHRLRLVAEMKIPGRAWLEFEVTGDSTQSTIRQTATFDPLGLFGLIYWYALYPIHRWIFAGMLRRVAEAGLSTAAANSSAVA
ncbi:MAG TPA: SDR family oxidoreductase [Terriglobia bacterium]|nr:SDR family oxidoreductase [Terriglobia bacterium]